MPRPAAIASSSRTLIFIMTAVVFFFVLATAISQYHLATIESHVRDSIGNALPSANHLSEARSHLNEIVNAAIDLRVKSEIPAAELRRRIYSSQKELNTAFSAYLNLPQFPQEQALAADLQHEI